MSECCCGGRQTSSSSAAFRTVPLLLRGGVRARLLSIGRVKPMDGEASAAAAASAATQDEDYTADRETGETAGKIALPVSCIKCQQ